MDLKAVIREIQDFPKAGISFKDITTLLNHPGAFREAHEALWDAFSGTSVDVIAGIEARGFIIAGALALEHNLGMIPIRKAGKLPAKTLQAEYALEYGTDKVEMHTDAILPGQQVLLVDDLLATGGTMEASCRLVEEAGGTIVGIGFFIELDFLNGRKKLESYNVQSLVHYDS